MVTQAQETWREALARMNLQVQDVARLADIPHNRMYRISKRIVPAEFVEAERIAVVLEQSIEWTTRVLSVLQPGIQGRGNIGRRPRHVVEALLEESQIDNKVLPHAVAEAGAA